MALLEIKNLSVEFPTQGGVMRAVVGSSAMSSLGLQAIAIAIMTRWFMPPESW